MGYNLRYDGKQPSPDGKDKVKIAVNNSTTYAKFYWSDYSRAYMVAPSANNHMLQDLYISPIQIIPAKENNQAVDNITLKKSETSSFEDLTFFFSGYDMNMHGTNSENIHVAAVIEVKDQYGKSLGMIKPALEIIGKESTPHPAVLPGSDRKVYINGINVEDGSLKLAITKNIVMASASAGKELLAVEVSIKPLINILWLGTFLMVFGFIASVIDYTRNRRFS